MIVDSTDIMKARNGVSLEKIGTYWGLPVFDDPSDTAEDMSTHILTKKFFDANYSGPPHIKGLVKSNVHAITIRQDMTWNQFKQMFHEMISKLIVAGDTDWDYDGCAEFEEDRWHWDDESWN